MSNEIKASPQTPELSERVIKEDILLGAKMFRILGKEATVDQVTDKIILQVGVKRNIALLESITRGDNRLPIRSE